MNFIFIDIYLSL